MRRRGYLLVEVFVACTILAALFALVVQMVSTTSQERRATERRAIALEQAANLLERISEIPFEQLSVELLDDVALPDDAARLLAENEVRWTVEDQRSELPTKRVQIELVWHAPHGRPDAPVRLSAWVFPDSAASAETPPAEIPAETPASAEEDPS